MIRSITGYEMHLAPQLRVRVAPRTNGFSTALLDPLIILAPMRSYSTVVSAMLGQHPQMYSLTETHLFTCDTMWEWWTLYRENYKLLGQGLLRAVAELIMGYQTEGTIEQARRWILRRLTWPTAEVFRALARRVDPSVLIDKSPLMVKSMRHLQRAHAEFPRARFLHLTRHPVTFGYSYLKFFESLGIRLTVDPQVVWHTQHSTILAFLETVPESQQLRIRGEDVLASPDQHLARIANWIGLRTSPDAIQQMKHPEQSPFANIGPTNAPLGGDPAFLNNPKLHPGVHKSPSLQGSLPWRRDGGKFTAEVRAIAEQFGYD